MLPPQPAAQQLTRRAACFARCACRAGGGFSAAAQAGEDAQGGGGPALRGGDPGGGCGGARASQPRLVSPAVVLPCTRQAAAEGVVLLLLGAAALLRQARPTPARRFPELAVGCTSSSLAHCCPLVLSASSRRAVADMLFPSHARGYTR